MIYYSNSQVDTPHLMFVGRWTPFHKGHQTIIETKRKQHPELPVLILVRATSFDAYQPQARAEVIKLWMLENNVEGTIMIIPDIHGIYWGRGVGYELEEVEVSQKVQQVSATRIRAGIKNGEDNWQADLASDQSAMMLTTKTAAIIEKGYVIWLTGCPCAGKTTISNKVYELVRKRLPFLKVQQLDGDVMRDTPLAQNAGFSPKDRQEHILRMGQLAKMFADHGILVIASFVSPDAKVRKAVKNMVGDERFLEVYVKARKKTREERDVKGLYAKAKAGKIKGLTGYDAPYDAPKKALVCDTDKRGIRENAEAVFGGIFS